LNRRAHRRALRGRWRGSYAVRGRVCRNAETVRALRARATSGVPRGQGRNRCGKCRNQTWPKTALCRRKTAADCRHQTSRPTSGGRARRGFSDIRGRDRRQGRFWTAARARARVMGCEAIECGSRRGRASSWRPRAGVFTHAPSRARVMGCESQGGEGWGGAGRIPWHYAHVMGCEAVGGFLGIHAGGSRDGEQLEGDRVARGGIARGRRSRGSRWASSKDPTDASAGRALQLVGQVRARSRGFSVGARAPGESAPSCAAQAGLFSGRAGACPNLSGASKKPGELVRAGKGARRERDPTPELRGGNDHHRRLWLASWGITVGDGHPEANA
jgi:hypothetical protein